MAVGFWVFGSFTVTITSNIAWVFGSYTVSPGATGAIMPDTKIALLNFRVHFDHENVTCL